MFVYLHIQIQASLPLLRWTALLAMLMDVRKLQFPGRSMRQSA